MELGARRRSLSLPYYHTGQNGSRIPRPSHDRAAGPPRCRPPRASVVTRRLGRLFCPSSILNSRPLHPRTPHLPRPTPCHRATTLLCRNPLAPPGGRPSPQGFNHNAVFGDSAPAGGALTRNPGVGPTRGQRRLLQPASDVCFSREVGQPLSGCLLPRLVPTLCALRGPLQIARVIRSAGPACSMGVRDPVPDASAGSSTSGLPVRIPEFPGVSGPRCHPRELPRPRSGVTGRGHWRTISPGLMCRP